MFNWINKNSRENRRKRRDPYKLDVKVRSSQRVQAQVGRGMLWLATLMAAGLVVFGLYQAFTFLVSKSFTENAAYSINEIKIETDGTLPRSQVVELAGVREGQNLFAVDLPGVRAALESHPVIRRAEIRRLLPDKLQIIISERVPIAQVYTKTVRDAAGRVTAPPAAYLIDATAVVMKPVGVFGATGAGGKPAVRLPLLTGVDAKLIKLGRRIESEQVQKALDLVHLCEGTEFAPLLDFDRVDVTVEGFLVMVMRQGGLVTFAAENLTTQLKRLKIVLTHPARAGRVIATCDLSVGLNVPVTYFTPPASTVPGAASVAMSGPQIINVRNTASGGRHP